MDDNPYRAPRSENHLFATSTVSPSLPITLHYDFGPEDLLSWYRLSIRDSSGGRRQRQRAIARSVILIFAAAAVAVLFFQSWWVAAVAFGLALLMSIMAPWQYDQHLEQTLRATVNDPRLAGGFGPHELTMSETGLHEVTPASESFVKWQFVTEVATDPDHVFIRLSSGQAAVIAREAFSGPIAFDEVESVIRRYAGRSP
jgi:hypothetical protein